MSVRKILVLYRNGEQLEDQIFTGNLRLILRKVVRVNICLAVFVRNLIPGLILVRGLAGNVVLRTLLALAENIGIDNLRRGTDSYIVRRHVHVKVLRLNRVRNRGRCRRCRRLRVIIAGRLVAGRIHRLVCLLGQIFVADICGLGTLLGLVIDAVPLGLVALSGYMNRGSESQLADCCSVNGRAKTDIHGVRSIKHDVICVHILEGICNRRCRCRRIRRCRSRRRLRLVGQIIIVNISRNLVAVGLKLDAIPLGLVALTGNTNNGVLGKGAENLAVRARKRTNVNLLRVVHAVILLHFLVRVRDGRCRGRGRRRKRRCRRFGRRRRRCGGCGLCRRLRSRRRRQRRLIAVRIAALFARFLTGFIVQRLFFALTLVGIKRRKVLFSGYYSCSIILNLHLGRHFLNAFGTADKFGINHFFQFGSFGKGVTAASGKVLLSDGLANNCSASGILRKVRKILLTGNHCIKIGRRALHSALLLDCETCIRNRFRRHGLLDRRLLHVDNRIRHGFIRCCPGDLRSDRRILRNDLRFVDIRRNRMLQMRKHRCCDC